MRATLIVPSLLTLAVALAATGASAQTVISRSISAEPVETTVTQTPTGTIVTRRPVEGRVMQQPLVQPPIVQTGPAIVQGWPPVVAREAETIDATTTREVVERAAATPATPRMRTRQVSARRDARRTPAHAARQTVQRATRTTTARPRLALNPRERHIIYQTIVEREVMPGRQVIVAPPPVVMERPLIQRPVALPAVQPPVVAADEDTVVSPAVPVYTVGSVLPPNVPLYAMPQNVALSVPAAQTYSYAYLNGRAYLVDPANGIIVADVTE